MQQYSVMTVDGYSVWYYGMQNCDQAEEIFFPISELDAPCLRQGSTSSVPWACIFMAQSSMAIAWLHTTYAYLSSAVAATAAAAYLNTYLGIS